MENGHHGRPADDAHARESGEVESYTWEAVTAGCCYDTGDPGQTDLILAAKLGKSLLEQNEELSADYYKIVRKLETVTQENYELRRQLDAAEETSGSLITELQGEVAALRERLAEVTHTLDTERGLKEAELDRLQLELAAATDRQEQLAREARDATEELRRERSSGEEQLREIQSMRRQLTQLEERKEDLEKLVSTLQFEKESLSNSLENAIAKIYTLERKQTDHETIIRTNEREMEELKTSNHYLLEKLELWSMSHSSSPTLKTSLMSELELSTSESSSDNSLQRSKHFDIIDEEDEEIAEYDTPLNNNSEILLRVADVTKFDEEVAAVTSRIIKINQRIKDECEPFSHSSGPGVDTLAEKEMSKLKYVTEELELLVSDTLLDKAIDLQSKGSQTNSSSYQSDWHETFLSDSDLNLAKIKIAELENENRKEEVIKNGLFEKLDILEARLSKVTAENTDLLSSLKKITEKKSREADPHKRDPCLCLAGPPAAGMKMVVEQNNNSLVQFSVYQQMESIEGMIKHILETKDPPKRLLRRS